MENAKKLKKEYFLSIFQATSCNVQRICGTSTALQTRMTKVNYKLLCYIYCVWS